jgi:hypothetical protein
VDASALRRRLGGFHQGAESGRRDVEAEIAGEEPAETPTTSDPAQRDEPSQGNEKNVKAADVDVMGDSVEEASS